MSIRRYNTIALGLLKKEEELEKEEYQIMNFNSTQCVRKLALYGVVVHSFDWKSAVEYDGGV